MGLVEVLKIGGRPVLDQLLEPDRESLRQDVGGGGGLGLRVMVLIGP